MNKLSVVGARPQFIKAAPVSAALRAAGLQEVLAHAGQHYDREIPQQFFEEPEIPEPAYNLGVGSGPHGRQTGQILIALEEVLQAERPDCVLVFGATNSTLAVTPGRLPWSWPDLRLPAPPLGTKMTHAPRRSPFPRAFRGRGAAPLRPPIAAALGSLHRLRGRAAMGPGDGLATALRVYYIV